MSDEGFDFDLSETASLLARAQRGDREAQEELFRRYHPKLEALLRKAVERSLDGLWRRIGELLAAFTPAGMANYLAHAGYA